MAGHHQLWTILIKKKNEKKNLLKDQVKKPYNSRLQLVLSTQILPKKYEMLDSKMIPNAHNRH